jgi:DAK2 domain fusion protein YloV
MGTTPQRDTNLSTGQAPSALVTLDATSFRRAFHAADVLLRRHVDVLNAINVYPVPDGDTGTNMSLTLRGALDGMDTAPPDAGIRLVAESLAKGAMMGARGNSGVILSQVLRGISESLVGPSIDGLALARSLASARETAYGALSQPKEGTILTAIREAAEAAERQAPSSATEILAVAATAAREAVERTPDMLPVLKEAGVVDAGALGLAIVLEGLRRSAAGESLDVDLTPADIDLSGSWRSDAASLHRDEHGDSGYCTEFLVAGRDLDESDARTYLQSFGTSLLVVGQSDLLRVHIHTTRPDDVLNYGRSLGELTQTKVDNLEAQIDSFAAGQGERGSDQAISVVAVASGGGIEQALRSIGVDRVIEGGQTMNPSAGEVLDAIDSAPADQVVVLPNNKNIIAAAEQAARESAKTVIVVPSRSIPQGIAAAIRLNPEVSLAENKTLMEHAVSSVRSGEVTRAVRATSIDGRDVRIGDAIGIVDDELCVVASSVEEALRKTVVAMSSNDASLLTLYAGRDLSDDDAEAMADALREEHTTLEVELIRGGQPHYLYLISLE